MARLGASPDRAVKYDAIAVAAATPTAKDVSRRPQGLIAVHSEDEEGEAPVEERGLLVSVNAAWFRSCRAIPAMSEPPSSMALTGPWMSDQLQPEVEPQFKHL
jgi:hypothetical protein